MGRTCINYGAIQKCIQSFNEKPEGKRPIGKPGHTGRWEGNIKMDLREVGCDPRD